MDDIKTKKQKNKKNKKNKKTQKTKKTQTQKKKQQKKKNCLFLFNVYFAFFSLQTLPKRLSISFLPPNLLRR